MSEVSAVGKVGKTIGSVFKGISSAITGAMGPLGMMIDLFGQLGIIQPLLDLLNMFVSILGTAFMPAMMLLMDAIVPLIPPFQELTTALTPIITLLMSMIMQSSGLNFILSLITPALQILTQALNFILPPFQQIATIFTNMTPENLIASLTQIGSIIVGLFTSINWVEVGTTLLNMIVSALAGLGQMITTIFNSIDWAAVGQSVLDGVSSALNSAGNAIVDFFT